VSVKTDPSMSRTGRAQAGFERMGSGWVAVDLPSSRSFIGVDAVRQPPAPSAPVSDDKAIVRARIAFWVERLRAPERPIQVDPSGVRPGRSERRVPAADVVRVGRKLIGKVATPEPRMIAGKRREHGRFRVGSTRLIRLILLAFAAGYFVGGVAHSVGRMKPSRVIEVPAPLGVTVIT
jgi:hypothetical protein